MNPPRRRPAAQAGSVSFFVPHLGCPNDCSYCNQRHISGAVEPPAPEAVRETLARILEDQPDRAAQMQVAFFGGSFTAVPVEYRRSLLGAAAGFCMPGGFSGIRLSTRPDSIDEAVLDELAGFPVRDIELGAQSMDDAVLEKNFRGHNSTDVERASALIKQRGFGLTLQMMTGLPGDTPEGAIETARRIAAQGPDAVRIYPTVVLKNTALERWCHAGLYTPQTLEEAVELGAALLTYFAGRDIPVIRLGLHDSEGLAGNRVAGPHHPALRELCEGKALCEKLLAQLRGLPPGVVSVRVSPRAVSALTGHGRRALRPLEEAGYLPIVRPDEGLGYLEAAAER